MPPAGTPPSQLLLSPFDASSEELVSSQTDFAVAARLPPATRHPPDLTSPTPRTPNRVRFALDDESTVGAIELEEARCSSLQHSVNYSWADEEDYFQSDDDYGSGDDDGRLGGGTRAPLLTGIEASSVTITQDIDDLLERSVRPKSGMFMAFFLQANAIVGAGIIGGPHQEDSEHRVDICWQVNPMRSVRRDWGWECFC